MRGAGRKAAVDLFAETFDLIRHGNRTVVFLDGQMSGENSASIHFIMKTSILYVCYTPNLILRKADQGQEAQPVPDLLFAFFTQVSENTRLNVKGQS